MNILDYSEHQILSIDKVGDLFTNDIYKCKCEYRDLAKKWHPDVNDKDTSEIFAHINDLYNKALDLISNKLWEKTNYCTFHTKDNKNIAINYFEVNPFEFGLCYICDKSVIYKFNSDKKKYFDNANNQIKNLIFMNSDMKKEFGRYVPEIINTFESDQNEYYLVLNKPQDVYPLKNIISYYSGNISDRHIAWIISRLLNITCYLNFISLTHNGITIDNCYVCPSCHTIILLGGWWYSTKYMSKLLGTTKEVYDVMPSKIKSTKIADYTTDLESIKLLGRKLMGETNCRLLKDKTDIPKPFIDFLISGSKNVAYDELIKWEETLKASYGVRKFIPMNIDKSKIYNGGK